MFACRAESGAQMHLVVAWVIEGEADLCPGAGLEGLADALREVAVEWKEGALTAPSEAEGRLSGGAEAAQVSTACLCWQAAAYTIVTHGLQCASSLPAAQLCS